MKVTWDLEVGIWKWILLEVLDAINICVFMFLLDYKFKLIPLIDIVPYSPHIISPVLLFTSFDYK